MDFVKGDTVVYGASGVCEIEDIRDISFYHEAPQKYFVMKPLFVKQAQVMYVPYDNEKCKARIRPVITKDEAMELIYSIDISDTNWIEDRNARKNTYGTMITKGDRKDIIQVINNLYAHQQRLEDCGKTLNQQDEKMLNDARHRIDAEFAVALDIDPKDVPDFILENARKT
ncbi:MAG: hypothetical protein MJ094_03000 [Saccharofermentans sp.]|nr:hypothetical protein [Saccharofermentans sp.]